MSILDPVQRNLASDIWTSDRQLRPEVREQILKKVYTFLDESNVMAMYIIGTITGFQYKNDSDVDVQVVVDPPELAEHGPETLVYLVQHTINGEIIKGTAHPLNFFLYGWHGTPANWKDSSFGVYDVLNNNWAHDPGTSDMVRDPALEYGVELNSAKMELRKFERLVERWERNIEKLSELSGDYQHNLIKGELRRDFLELLEFCHELDRERKFEYDMKWGVPRKNWRNLMFKVLESGKYKDYFEFFKDLKVDDYYTKLALIVKEKIEDGPPVISYRAYKKQNRLLPGIEQQEKI